jgi:hypothetical protein
MFKRNKLITILSALISLFAILIISAWAINRYVYDLVHHVSIFGKCEGKQIGTSTSTSGNKNDKVGEFLDLINIKNALKDNQHYRIKAGSDAYYLEVIRNFKDKEYVIRFTNVTYTGASHSDATYFYVRTDGELCMEPDYSIEQRFIEMIDGLPLSDFQKQTIKNNVEVSSFGDGSFVGF